MKEIYPNKKAFIPMLITTVLANIPIFFVIFFVPNFKEIVFPLGGIYIPFFWVLVFLNLWLNILEVILLSKFSFAKLSIDEKGIKLSYKKKVFIQIAFDEVSAITFSRSVGRYSVCFSNEAAKKERNRKKILFRIQINSQTTEILSKSIKNMTNAKVVGLDKLPREIIEALKITEK